MRARAATLASGAGRAWRGHRTFVILFAVAALLRLTATLGYAPALWFTDSFDYVRTALSATPDTMRPNGYPFLLTILRPFHSFALVVTVQHLMGLAVGLMVYLLLRKRFGLPGWGAALAAAPALLDPYQIQLEQLILSDVMFIFLVMAAVTLLLWHGRPSYRVAAGVGLLVGVAWLTRSVGMPVLLGIVVFLMIRRTGWRTIAVTVAACMLPVVTYTGWYKIEHGRFGMTDSGSVFLFSRVYKFADCHKIRPPVEEMPLCVEPGNRMPYSQDALWQKPSPLNRYLGPLLDPEKQQVASSFAVRAILAQPGDYARTVATDFLRAFRWDRPVFPEPATYARYEFGTRGEVLGTWPIGNGRTARDLADSYEHGPTQTRVDEPFAWVIRTYQDHFRLPGTVLGVLLLIGLGVVASTVGRWFRKAEAQRDEHGTLGAFLPWSLGTGLLLVPAATAEFDYRYILPSLPLACLAAALAFTPEARTRMAGWLKRDKEEAVPEVAPAVAEKVPG